ncbi:MAG: response regulator transcription factor [Chloroflexi bacterium]|nr:response regulator transcription factor [Chloroflexota bacterium]
MGRRIIRRRRPAMSRRVVVRRSAPVDAPQTAQPARAAGPEKSPVMVATSNSVRNLLLSKMATIKGVALAAIADTPENALKLLIQEHPDVVVLDADFGGPFEGLDTAKMMQKMRSQSAIIMVVSELDPVALKSKARRYGTSWSYLKKTTVSRADVLAIVLKSASRGVQWIEPELSRPLAEIWKISAQARDLETQEAHNEPDIVAKPGSYRERPAIDEDGEHDEVAVEFDDDGVVDVKLKSTDEAAPGVDLQSTDDFEDEGINLTSISVGKGGVGQGVGKVRRTG